METISFQIRSQLKEKLPLVKGALNSTQSDAIKEEIYAFTYFYRIKKSRKSLKKFLRNQAKLEVSRG